MHLSVHDPLSQRKHSDTVLQTVIRSKYTRIYNIQFPSELAIHVSNQPEKTHKTEFMKWKGGQRGLSGSWLARDDLFKYFSNIF